MMRITFFTLFLLIGCSKFAADQDWNDTKFYAFQQKCLAEIEAFNMGTKHNAQNIDWMKTLISE